MSANSIVIRHANINDIPDILPLLAQLGYPCDLKDLRARFKRFIQNPGYGVVVACLDDRSVGWVAWSKSDLFVLDKVRFHIEGLIVEENYRGMGIGKKLMKFVEDIAKQHTPIIVDLTSGLRRASDGSHEFYKRLGYQNEGPMAKLYLRKEL